MTAIKTAIPTLVFSAISDAATAQPEMNKMKKKKRKTIRMYHPWSYLTDGGLNAMYVEYGDDMAKVVVEV